MMLSNDTFYRSNKTIELLVYRLEMPPRYLTMFYHGIYFINIITLK